MEIINDKTKGFINQGFEHEYALVRATNEKKVKDLNPFLQDTIRTIFKEIKDEDIIYSKLCNRFAKPDISIKINDNIKYLSIKSGRTNSAHFEKIREFIVFLESLDISKETIETILLFHYGDGTIDGSGEKRMLFDELFPIMHQRIQKANQELNTKELTEIFLDRFVFDGVKKSYLSVDYIYYGDINYGVVCSKYDIKRFVLNRNYNHIRTLHFGPLTFQPFLRDIDFKSHNPQKREYMQIKWHYILSDLERIQSYKKNK